MMERPDDVPKSVYVSNLARAESVREKIQKREANILAALEDNERLVVEHHAPTGMVVLISASAPTKIPTTR